MTAAPPDRPRPIPQATGPRSDNPAIARIIFTVLLPFAGGYFLSYLYRNVNSVIAPDLLQALGIGAGALGYLTAAYFLAFAACQLPLGVLLDRFGPRRVEALLLLVAAAGAILFAGGESVWTLTLGRALIGVGVSACLMAAFKANSLWWPPAYLPLANSSFMVVGGIGAMAATTPVHLALAAVPASSLFLILAAATVAVAAVIWLVVPDRDPGAPPSGWAGQIAGVRTVLRSPAFIALAPVTVTIHSAVLAYHGLWTGPWLRDVNGFDDQDAAATLFRMSAALTVGFIATGFAAHWLARRGVSPLLSMTLFSLMMMAVEAGLLLDPPGAAVPLWMAFTFFGTASIICYAVLAQCFPLGLGGRVATALNFVVFTGAFVWQWGVGAIIDLYPARPDGGFRPDGYIAGMVVLLIMQALSVLWLVRHWRAVRPPA